MLYETTIALMRGTAPPGAGVLTAAGRHRASARRVRRAVSAQENDAARACPRRTRSARKRSVAEHAVDGGRRRRPRRRGSTSRAATPKISFSAGRRLVTTGTPRAMASSTGSPKPSYSERRTKTSAAA